MEGSATREEVRDLRNRIEGLTRDIGDWAHDKTHNAYANSRDWVVTHPKSSVGIMAGVAVGLGFALGFMLGRGHR